MSQFEIYEFVNEPINKDKWFTADELSVVMNIRRNTISRNINALVGVSGVEINNKFPVKGHHCYRFAIKGVKE